MKVTVVMENNVPARIRRPYLAEHGLSMLLDTGNKLYLFDTGQTSAVIHNLSLLGVHPSALDGIILSHGHYDHTGGLYAILTHAKKKIPVYANDGIFVPRFSRSQDDCSYIGVPYPKDLLISLGAEFNFLQAPLQLNSNLWISGPVPRKTEEKGDSRLVTRCCEGCETTDTIPDDLSLYCQTPNGLVVICGCAHAGLVNILRYGFELTDQKRLHGIIGGTHLGGVSDEQCLTSLKEIEKLNPDFVAANHCTGFNVMARLQDLLKDRFIPAFVGTIINC
ncbi:MAG: beta-lactamase domain protein [Firmicutes bacterium]|nr:beta-lactamase domain protein [Bacillota bacterium]